MTSGKRMWNMRKIRVLVAEDDHIIAASYVDALKSSCEIVGVARDGQEALDALLEYAPDILVLDLILPVLDGLELMSVLRYDYPGCKTKIILVSSFMGPAIVAEAIHLGVDYMMVKPIQSSVLAKRVLMIAQRPVGEAGKEGQSLGMQAMDILKRMGLTSNYTGFQYALIGMELFQKERAMTELSSKWIYHEIANKCGKSASNVERAMRYAVNKAWERPGNRVMRQKFSNKRPTVFQLVKELSVILPAELKS